MVTQITQTLIYSRFTSRVWPCWLGSPASRPDGGSGKLTVLSARQQAADTQCQRLAGERSGAFSSWRVRHFPQELRNISLYIYQMAWELNECVCSSIWAEYVNEQLLPYQPHKMIIFGRSIVGQNICERFKTFKHFHSIYIQKRCSYWWSDPQNTLSTVLRGPFLWSIGVPKKMICSEVCFIFSHYFSELIL